MKRVVFDCFPGGRRKALHMSYDDGMTADRRLVEIFNAHGIRGTFHLNSGHLDRDGYVSSSEVAALYAGHEVGVHTVTHPCLTHLPRERVIEEIIEDRRALERLTGYVVRGMSYPGGDYNDAVVAMLPTLGIAYSRTCERKPDFSMPEDPYRWPFSCHHGEALERAQAFLKVPPLYGLQLFYVMGHSFEFERGGDWAMIEEFSSLTGARDDIWYATQIEIVDYMAAVRGMRVSADGSILTNPSALPVWCSLWEHGRAVETVEIAAGGTTICNTTS